LNPRIASPTLSAESIELQGSYRIGGPNTTVEGDFSFGSNDAIADDLLSTLAVYGDPRTADFLLPTSGLPGSLGISQIDSEFLSFDGNSDPALFQEVVDG